MERADLVGCDRKSIYDTLLFSYIGTPYLVSYFDTYLMLWPNLTSLKPLDNPNDTTTLLVGGDKFATCDLWPLLWPFFGLHNVYRQSVMVNLTRLESNKSSGRLDTTWIDLKLKSDQNTTLLFVLFICCCLHREYLLCFSSSNILNTIVVLGAMVQFLG